MPHAEGTREQLIVTAGSLGAGHLADLHDLVHGDSIVFDGTAAHRYVAGPQCADVVVILTSPATS